MFLETTTADARRHWRHRCLCLGVGAGPPGRAAGAWAKMLAAFLWGQGLCQSHGKTTRKQSGETRCKVIQSEKRCKAWCAEMSWTVAPEIADSAFGELCAMLCACSSKVRSVRVLANAVDILGRHPTLSQQSTSRVKLFPEKSKQRAVSCDGSYCSTKFYMEAPHLPPRPCTL